MKDITGNARRVSEFRMRKRQKGVRRYEYYLSWEEHQALEDLLRTMRGSKDRDNSRDDLDQSIEYC